MSLGQTLVYTTDIKWHHSPHWLNWLEHESIKFKVTGSSPVWGHIASIAQLAVRGTYNAEVMGSSPIIRIVVGSDIKSMRQTLNDTICFYGLVVKASDCYVKQL